ncbi:MAG: ABC transporter ATP-binding protein [Parvibaculales bacterium]
MTGFSFANVSQKYGKFAAIHNLTLSVEAGESICLLGPSGSGKTTVLRLLAGIEQPSEGEILINGSLVSDNEYMLPLEKRGIGYLFQDFALFPHLTVLENVLFGLADPKSAPAKNRAIEVLSKTGALKLVDKYPETLSGGEQQRVALARALAPNPKLVLMDEPFSNLDMQLRDNMRLMTSDLVKKDGCTSLVVTHDPDDAMRLADKIAVMLDGHIVQFDVPHKIYENPVSLEVAQLLGPVNSCQVKNLPQGVLPDNLSPDTGIGFRPEAIRLQQAGLNEDRTLSVRGKLTHQRKVGADWRGVITVTPSASHGVIWDIYSKDALPESPDSDMEFVINREDLMIFDT